MTARRTPHSLRIGIIAYVSLFESWVREPDGGVADCRTTTRTMPAITYPVKRTTSLIRLSVKKHGSCHPHACPRSVASFCDSRAAKTFHSRVAARPSIAGSSPACPVLCRAANLACPVICAKCLPADRPDQPTALHTYAIAIRPVVGRIRPLRGSIVRSSRGGSLHGGRTSSHGKQTASVPVGRPATGASDAARRGRERMRCPRARHGGHEVRCRSGSPRDAGHG